MNEKMVMAARFLPYEWWLSGRARPEEYFTEADIMWVYMEVDVGIWQVGFFSPSGQWFSDSDHGTKSEAAKRYRYLNGGND